MKRQKIRKLLLTLSFFLFPITLFYFSPYLIILGGMSGIITGSFLIFAALFLFSVIFGRAFCGWLCPAGGLQECLFPAVDKKVKNRKVDLLKYFIWVPWLVGIIIAFATTQGINSIDFFYMTVSGISVASISGFMTYLAIIILITVLALTLGKRGMCHSICWMAPFMVLGTKLKNVLRLPSLSLKPEPNACVSCKLCTTNCPMSLPVDEMISSGNTKNSECILCGECADICPKSAIKLSFQKPAIK